VSGITVGRNADGRLELFAIDALTYAVEHKAQLRPNSSFNQVWSEDLDGATRVLAKGITVGNEADGRLEVFAVDAVTQRVLRQAEVRPNSSFSRQWINDLGDFSGSATHLDVAAGSPSQVAGTPFPITITARDAQNAIATGYRGSVHFSSSDPHATLP